MISSPKLKKLAHNFHINVITGCLFTVLACNPSKKITVHYQACKKYLVNFEHLLSKYRLNLTLWKNKLRYWF